MSDKEIRKDIKNGNISEVIKLLDSNPQLLNEVMPFGTWLHLAARKGELEIIKYLVDKGIKTDINAGSFDANALKTASNAGHSEIVKYLLL